MASITNLSEYRQAKQSSTLPNTLPNHLDSSEETLALLLSDLKATVARMEVLGQELLETQRKLEHAEKRAQWAQQSMDNLRGLCVKYIKSECKFKKPAENKELH